MAWEVDDNTPVAGGRMGFRVLILVTPEVDCSSTISSVDIVKKDKESSCSSEKIEESIRGRVR